MPVMKPYFMHQIKRLVRHNRVVKRIKSKVYLMTSRKHECYIKIMKLNHKYKVLMFKELSIAISVKKYDGKLMCKWTAYNCCSLHEIAI